MISLMRDMDDKGLGQNKVLYSFLGVKLPWSTTMQVSQCFLRQGDKSPAIRRLVSLELHWLRFLLDASSFLPH